MTSPRNGQPAVVVVKFIEDFGDSAKGTTMRLAWSVARELCLAGKAVVVTDQSSGRCVLGVPGQ